MRFKYLTLLVWSVRRARPASLAQCLWMLYFGWCCLIGARASDGSRARVRVYVGYESRQRDVDSEHIPQLNVNVNNAHVVSVKPRFQQLPMANERSEQ